MLDWGEGFVLMQSNSAAGKIIAPLLCLVVLITVISVWLLMPNESAMEQASISKTARNAWLFVGIIEHEQNAHHEPLSFEEVKKALEQSFSSLPAESLSNRSAQDRKLLVRNFTGSGGWVYDERTGEFSINSNQVLFQKSKQSIRASQLRFSNRGVRISGIEEDEAMPILGDLIRRQ